MMTVFTRSSPVRAYQSSSKVDRRGVRKFRRAAKAAMLLVEDRQRGLHHDADDARRELGLRAGKAFGVVQHLHGLVRRVDDFVAALAIGFGDGQQNLLEAGTPILIERREIGATVKRLAFGSEKDGERPAARAR